MKNTLLVTAFIACFAVSGRAASITLSSPGPLTTGNAFDVEVRLTNVFSGLAPADLLLGYGFSLNVGNNSIVSYTGETASPFATDISAGVSPVIAGIFFPGLGTGDFTEPLTLATLHFTALTAGSTTISVSADLSDFVQGLTFIDSATQGIAGTVTTVAADTPEPATLAMSALALSVVAALRRRSTAR